MIMVSQIIRHTHQIIIVSITNKHINLGKLVSHFVSHHLTVSKVSAYNSIGYTLNEQGNGAAETQSLGTMIVFNQL